MLSNEDNSIIILNRKELGKSKIERMGVSSNLLKYWVRCFVISFRGMSGGNDSLLD